MTLPKDIEEAIELLAKICWEAGGGHAFCDNPVYETNRKEATESLKRIITCKLSGDAAPTQRQRYKEAALQGLIAYRKDDGWPPDTAAQYAGQYADECLAEDAEHAKKEKAQ